MSQPPPNRESLQTLLARVHERLSEAGSVDADSRELLGQVMADIERALQDSRGSQTRAAPAGTPTASTAPVAAAKEHTPRLEALAVQFEADHPALADGLRSLADLLGKAGI
jgi:predicted component of type VI protein secretion system